MSGAASKFSSHWRRAGLNYLEMITVASNALRKVYKEPKRTQALASARVAFREFKYTDGKEGAPIMFDSNPSLAVKSRY